MTAYCCRLNQPENRRRKKASGGGSASMVDSSHGGRRHFKDHGTRGIMISAVAVAQSAFAAGAPRRPHAPGGGSAEFSHRTRSQRVSASSPDTGCFPRRGPR